MIDAESSNLVLISLFCLVSFSEPNSYPSSLVVEVNLSSLRVVLGKILLAQLVYFSFFGGHDRGLKLLLSFLIVGCFFDLLALGQVLD